MSRYDHPNQSDGQSEDISGLPVGCKVKPAHSNPPTSPHTNLISRASPSPSLLLSCALTIAVGRVCGRAGESGSRDVDASHHAWLFVRYLPIPFVLLVLFPAVPHAALWWILVRALEARLIERDFELEEMPDKNCGNYYLWFDYIVVCHLFSLNNEMKNRNSTNSTNGYIPPFVPFMSQIHWFTWMPDFVFTLLALDWGQQSTAKWQWVLAVSGKPGQVPAHESEYYIYKNLGDLISYKVVLLLFVYTWLAQAFWSPMQDLTQETVQFGEVTSWSIFACGDEHKPTWMNIHNEKKKYLTLCWFLLLFHLSNVHYFITFI